MSNNPEKKDKSKPFKDIEFLSLKTTFKAILIILFILLSVLLVFSVKSVAITQDIDYTFENDILHNGIPKINNSFNLRNQTIINELNYSATYDFLDVNDINDWDLSTPADTSITITDTFENHNKVMNLTDLSNTNLCQGNQSFSNQVSGTVEYWSYTPDASEYTVMYFLEGNTEAFRIGFRSDDIQYVDVGGWQILEANIDVNLWYHFKLVFDCTNDTADIYINNILEINDFSFLYVVNNINKISITTTEGSFNTYTYFNAIGYSWDIDYTVSQNLICYESITTNLQEVNRYEFNFEGVNDIYEIGDDNPSTWTDWEASGDNVNVHYNYQDNYKYYNIDRTVLIRSLDTNVMGLWKDNIGLSGKFINITYAFNFTVYNNNDGLQYTLIYSSDNTEIIHLAILKIGGSIRLSYETTSYQLLYDGLNLNDYYEFNLFIHYKNHKGILIMKENGIYIDTFEFPLKVYGKEGLRKVKILSLANTGNEIKFMLNYVGIYNKGKSEVESYAFVEIKLWNNPHWKFNENNLFNITSIGYLELYKYYSFTKQDYSLITGNTQLIENFRHYDNTSYFKNLYDLTQGGTFGYASLILYTTNNISISNLYINGVLLTQGINEYYPIINNTYANIQENYFYVVNNRLYFNIDLNESSYEGIQAIFDIDNESSTNSTISFKGKYDGVIPSYLVIDYLYYESSYMEMKYYSTSNRYLIPQGKTITKIIINVSDYIPFQDNYTNHNEGYISGYIYDISLNFLPNIEYTLSTMTLISGFIPLIVIFTPTIALFSKFGKKIILPSMILMTIICFVSQLIPLWLFSISMLIYGYLIIMDKYEGDI